MKHLDLFSGIGGFALAVESVWPEVEHSFVEIDPFCNAVLKKHWPNAKYHDDIKTFAGGGTADIVTGGFPCQPFSAAGKRRGTEDDRHLWPEMLRVIREASPRWVVGENVGGLLTWNGGMVLDEVFSNLEAEGYEVWAFVIPAVAVNAPHRRDRVWIVAHASSERRNDGVSDREGRHIQADEGLTTKNQSKRKGRKRGAGEVNSNAPHTRREHGSERRDEKMGSGETVRTARITDSKRRSQNGANTKRERLERSESENTERLGGFAGRNGSYERRNWSQNWAEIATRLCRVDDGIPKRLDRNPRLKALGNAIVPQVAQEIMRAINAIDP